MSDIVDDLRLALRGGMRPGTPDSDVNAMLTQIPVVDIERAIVEIERLRSLAGAVSDGLSYQEIAKSARHEVPITDTQTPRTDG